MDHLKLPAYVGTTTSNTIILYQYVNMYQNKINEETKPFLKESRKIYNFKKYNKQKEQIKKEILQVVKDIEELNGITVYPRITKDGEYVYSNSSGIDIENTSPVVMVMPSTTIKPNNMQKLFPEAIDFIDRIMKVEPRTYQHKKKIPHQEWLDSLIIDMDDMINDTIILVDMITTTDTSINWLHDTLLDNGVGNVIKICLGASRKIVDKEPEHGGPLVKAENTRVAGMVPNDTAPDPLAVMLGIEHEMDEPIFEQFIDYCYEIAEQEFLEKDGQRGRPPKYGLDDIKPIVRRILYHASRGAGRRELALELGCMPQYISEWERRSNWFREALKIAEELSMAWWERLGRKNVINKSFNTNLYKHQMENRFPHIYRVAKGLNVNINGTVQHELDNKTARDALKGLPTDQLELLVEALESEPVEEIGRAGLIE